MIVRLSKETEKKRKGGGEREKRDTETEKGEREKEKNNIFHHLVLPLQFIWHKKLFVLISFSLKTLYFNEILEMYLNVLFICHFIFPLSLSFFLYRMSHSLSEFSLFFVPVFHLYFWCTVYKVALTNYSSSSFLFPETSISSSNYNYTFHYFLSLLEMFLSTLFTQN